MSDIEDDMDPIQAMHTHGAMPDKGKDALFAVANLGFDVEVHQEGMEAGVIEQVLRDSGMSSRGKGRTLVTDNWYSSGSLMAGIWKEFGITFMGTINLTSKKSRTADDFQFHKEL
jgi:hypothetical protein